ncbi:MAG: diguanylate cyclase [Mariprofundus sp.]|nr:diguanylate cyclase [Mariprofundus sp.]
MPEFHSTVLLVDDQNSIHLALKKMLAPADDIQLHFCKQARQALDMAVALQPTVILQDLNMPEIDGLDLLHSYKRCEAIADVPVLILSGTDSVETKAEAFRQGADDYLVKMPHEIELLARLRHHTKAFVEHQERVIAMRQLEQEKKKLAVAYLELERLASIDGLTNIANRRHFDESFAKEWSRAMRETESLSLLMIDIDCFKQYNDSYGHLAGDECLKLVAASLKQHLQRPTDLLARYGGEEFVVLLPGTHARGAIKVAERLRKEVLALQLPHENSVAHDYVSISLGSATVAPMLKHQALELLQLADKALYEAKDGGRNQVICAGM